MSNDDSRIKELTIALQVAEQKLTERKTLITAAIEQTEAALSSIRLDKPGR